MCCQLGTRPKFLRERNPQVDLDVVRRAIRAPSDEKTRAVTTPLTLRGGRGTNAFLDHSVSARP